MDEEEPRWSSLSAHELLDKAQQAATSEMAMALLAAAQVQATNDLSWTLEYRILPRLGQRP